MWRTYIAEFRDSWPVWLGVSINFIVLNLVLTLSSLTMYAGVVAVQAGILQLDSSTAFTISPGMNAVLCFFVGAVVVGSATGLVVNSRRGSLARLSLCGATPRQIIRSIMVQLVIVTLLCAVMGDILAVISLDPLLHYLSRDPGEEYPMIAAHYVLWPILVANAATVLVALIGGYKQARVASQILPVEALRQSVGSGENKMTVMRWVGAAVYLVIIIGAFAGIKLITEEKSKETISNLFITSLVLLVVTGVLIARLAPLLIGPVTKLWIRCIPTRSPSWFIAKNTTIAKASRLTKSTIPVMMAVGLLFGMVLLGGSLQSSIVANGYNVQLSGVGLTAALNLLAAPLAVALAGAVGSLIMMSKQRDGELALTGIIGATPAQRIIMPILEGVIITVTGVLLALVMVGVAMGYLVLGFASTDYIFVLPPSLTSLAILLVATTIIMVSATLLPTLRALRSPERQVIARLIAE